MRILVSSRCTIRRARAAARRDARLRRSRSPIARTSGAAIGPRSVVTRLAANKFAEGLQLHWLGFIFEDVVVQKTPRYCRDQQSADQRLFNAFCYSY
jgi:hypothetical protein